MPTTDELDARLRKFEDFFTFVTNPYTGQIGTKTAGRLGVMTDYWMKRPANEGAALSVGTIDNQYAVYAEIEADTSPGRQCAAYYARCDVLNPTQPNVAFESHVNNSGVANVDLLADGAGIGLAARVTSWAVGKLEQAIQLWP